MPLSQIVKSAWEYFVLGFALLILPDEQLSGFDNSGGDHDQSQNHEDDAFRLWDDIGGEG